MNAKNVRYALLFLSLLVSGPTWAIPTYSDIYVFGDSLSDTDLFNNNTDYRASNGDLWVEYLAPQLGLSYDVSTNYAQHGATTGDILNQVMSYDPVNSVDPNALYVTWGGPNDLFDAVASAYADPSNPNLALISSTISAAVDNLSTAVGSLAAAGASNILVPNMPNLGLTPGAIFLEDYFVNDLGFDPFVIDTAEAVSSEFNMALDMALAGIDYYQLDVFALLGDVVADPSSYDFTNVTQGCISDPSGIEGPLLFSDCTGYMFFDFIHPTTETHELLSSYMYAAVVPASVPEPATFALMSLGLMGVGFARCKKSKLTSK